VPSGFSLKASGSGVIFLSSSLISCEFSGCEKGFEPSR